MKRAVIYFGDSYCNLKADRITICDNVLCIYDGDTLVGVFRETEFKCAYLTETAKNTEGKG